MTAVRNYSTAESDKSLPSVQLGVLSPGTYWLQLADGRMFQIDEDTRLVAERLLAGETCADIAREGEWDEAEPLQLEALLSHAGAGALSPQELPVAIPVDPSVQASSSQGKWALPAATCILLLVAGLQLGFAFTYPPVLASGLEAQWSVTAALTGAVVLHELGHWWALHGRGRTRLRLDWAGPLPMFSIESADAWKLSRRRRILIDCAGVGMDLVTAGAAALLGLLFPPLHAAVWTFLVMQWFRMGAALFPFFPGDGYWLVVDAVNRPLLWKEAAAARCSGRSICWPCLACFGTYSTGCRGRYMPTCCIGSCCSRFRPRPPPSGSGRCFTRHRSCLLSI
ncbi:hypothetical protein LJK87_09310 [Paenibacillus sp. P25]|nr:hypothetical protein LJK87_09310 [Paenibacillus sp. P25]